MRNSLQIQKSEYTVRPALCQWKKARDCHIVTGVRDDFHFAANPGLRCVDEQPGRMRFPLRERHRPHVSNDLFGRQAVLRATGWPAHDDGRCPVLRSPSIFLYP